MLAKVIVLKLVMLALAIVLRLVRLVGPAATAVSVNCILAKANELRFKPLCWVVEDPAALLEKSLLWFTKATIKSSLFWISLSAVEFKVIALVPVLHDVTSAE